MTDSKASRVSTKFMHPYFSFEMQPNNHVTDQICNIKCFSIEFGYVCLVENATNPDTRGRVKFCNRNKMPVDIQSLVRVGGA